jgi:hypothetical protein
MKRTTRPKRRPNSLKKIRDLYRLGALPVGAVHRVDICHDGLCAHFQGQPCHCNPSVHLKYSVPGYCN